jgi:soluble lytic murein transglycosylase
VLARHRRQPLHGWLEFAALRRDLSSLPLDAGRDFLRRHGGQPVGEAFRVEWLAALGKRGEWQALLAAWQDGIESPALRCLQLQARHQLGRDDAGWVRDAQGVWRSSGKSLPAQCDPVFVQLASHGALPDALRWERFDLAAEAQEAGVMRAIGRGLSNADDAALAAGYAAYMEGADASAAGWPKTARSRLVASQALARLGKAAPDRAERLLPAIAQALGFGDAERGRVLYQVALWTVASYLPGSARRLASVPLSAYDASLHEWQVREALSRSDWAAALAAIRRMPATQRDDSRWQYFAARTSELTGDAVGARALYAKAAAQSDFHGFLAADRLGQPYALCPWQPVVSHADKLAVARDPAIVRAMQLHALDRKGWAVREWKDALSRFSDEQRRIAVEVAQDNGWFDRAVFGLVNVDGKAYPDERRLYHLRFPLHHDATIRREAARHHLDPAWIAAEIRAESVFDPNARSPADARGLMQVLPATGAGVAARIGMPWRGGDSLFDPDTNIALGSAYLRQLMDQYGGKIGRAHV